MQQIKKVLLLLLVLEIFNLIISLVYNGREALLPYTNYNAEALYYDMDSLYGVTKLKDTKQIVNYSGSFFPKTIKTNSLGFRDEEFKNNSVLVLGNSFVEGFGLDAEDRFTDILEKKLNISFSNAGAAGVWTPIQSLVLLDYLLKNKKIKFRKAILILTPNELSLIGSRNPQNDPTRNFPFKKNDSIVFYKSLKNDFNKSLSTKNKIKRVLSNTLILKLYKIVKYYGVSRRKPINSSFNKENFIWFLNKIDEKNFDQTIDIIIINNLMGNNLLGINEFCSKIKKENKKIRINIVQFPNNQALYFTSNGHINKKGNEILANLILKKVF